MIATREMGRLSNVNGHSIASEKFSEDEPWRHDGES